MLITLGAHEPLAALTSAPALRDDIRRLGDLLGEALIRQEGQATYEIVERIRALSRDDPDAAAELIDELPLAEATTLARAFSLYFHLANIAEQVHRSRAQAARPRQHRRPPGRGRGGDPCRRWRPARSTAAEVADGFARISARPVFTAHPTEASRRSVLVKLRRIAELLDEPPDRTAPTARSPSRSTCSGRPTSCAWASPR